MKILIVKLSSLGDVVHAMPAVQDIRGALPHATRPAVATTPSMNRRRPSTMAHSVAVEVAAVLGLGDVAEVLDVIVAVLAQGREAHRPFVRQRHVDGAAYSQR